MLPEVYPSDQIIGVVVKETPENPIVTGDMIFLFTKNDNNENFIIGKYTYQDEVLDTQLVGFLNESANPTAPSLQTGAKFGQTVYFGFLQNSTGKLYQFAPNMIVSHLTGQVVSEMIAQPFNVYILYVDNVYKEIGPLKLCPYYEWMYAQDPDAGEVIVRNLSTTPTVPLPLLFVPKYVTKVNYSVLGDSVIINGTPKKIIPGVNDLKTGIINIIADCTGYNGQRSLFNYKYTFPPKLETLPVIPEPEKPGVDIQYKNDTPLEGSVFDNAVFIKQDGYSLIIGNRTLNTMISFTVKRSDGIPIQGGSVKSVEGQKTFTLARSVVNKLRGTIVKFTYQTVMNKISTRSEYKTIDLLIV